jgi:hypothetical protein
LLSSYGCGMIALGSRGINHGLAADIMFSRRRLIWGLLVCLVIFEAAVAFQADPTLSVWQQDTLVFVEIGSAASAAGTFLVLIATA